ncbi:pantoate--beta-alanine ligase [Christiangramia forsetii]|uniref:Pantothenate synthetase n=2 Tax=Christiangramia forsetii TaxID=411153 RepID=PANC_CHRFK|nr:pantoate--beta-alanine ligase [Christiangramia forsetii]A0M787.1 RecName: Full=Pantothenate synthetase; Short=PS; AltName: Full=Pantoate--beta-alanine ligase; AltName: Full=Pantoate-activating enzyme [Christiangramia forsetii KT0803]GGG28455.1 pantothenate synthetase [Christiangramia forsetii]CAL68482.1 pantoate-beta-alanine ligase [Christiangramia forsetii KT0803]
MQVFREKQLLIQAIQKVKSDGKSIGLVPTMGALHEGHLSLVTNALKDSDQVIVSIFVNPTQFDNPEDLEKYPRNLNKDIELLEKETSDIWVFSPTANELYGDKILSQNFDFEGLESVMEGEFRAGHFNGVGTVVKHLFEVITPDKAFFGEKDFQQLQIIRKLIEKTGLPVEIVGCPILREDSGLARSSRNERLSFQNRKEAAFIYEVLQNANRLFGTESAEHTTNWVENQFKNNQHLKLEYFEIADSETLKKVNKKEKGKQYRAFIAAYSDGIRLIDNIALNN